MKYAPSKLMRSAVLGASMALMAMPAQANEVKLESLRPTDAKYLTRQNPALPDHPHGEEVWSSGGVFRNWSHVHFWPDNVKIVKEAPELPEGFIPAAHPGGYYSWDADRFVVDGESVAGVGLWLRIFSMEHWIDFKIPHRARSFSALVYLTDDNKGYMNGQGHYAGGREGVLKVYIDDKLVDESLKFYDISNPQGKLVGTLDLRIPPNAKKIRFHLVGSDALDWNKNAEIVITDGVFE